MFGTGGHRRERLRVVGPGKQAGGREQHPARIVRNLEWSPSCRRGHAAGGQQDGTAWRAMLLGDLGELVPDEGAQLLGLSKISVSSAMVASSLPRSVSSSIRLNRVSLRSGISRM